MKQAYFIFNNISSEDYLMVNALPPIIKAQQNIEKKEIEGRDGFLTINSETYKGIVKPVECTIFSLEDIDFICGWLNGSSDVIFSNEPDKIYKATIINQIEFKKIAVEFHSLIIQFDCQPHKYSISNDVMTLTSAGIVYNATTTDSKPIMTIYGSGNVNLTINGITIYLTNVDEYVTLDSYMIDAYKETQLKNNDMDGEFPILEVGNNAISWTGSVSKIEITPNWRYI